jgi:hypothetical protein
MLTTTVTPFLVEFHEEFHCIKYADVVKRGNVPVEFHGDETLLTSHETLTFSLSATSTYLM